MSSIYLSFLLFILMMTLKKCTLYIETLDKCKKKGHSDVEGAEDKLIIPF